MRSALEEVGGFDEAYWMYWEDADLCRRSRRRRLGVCTWNPAAIVHHTGGASGTSERTIRAFHESAARFAARWIARSRLEAQLYRVLLSIRGGLALRSFRRSQRER